MADTLRETIQQAIRNTVATEGVPGLMGRADGTVYYTDPGGTTYTNRVYVRLGEGDSPTEVVAYATAVPIQYDLPIVVANRHGTPTVIRVDARRADAYYGDSPSAVATHRHDRYSTNPLYITGPAFLPLMARPSSPTALTVTVEAGFYRYLATEKALDQTTTGSLASHRPSAGLQTFIVISLDRSANALTITDSGNTDTLATAIPFDVADVLATVGGLSDSDVPLAAIRLGYGQTTIEATDIFMDLRMHGGEFVAGVLTIDDLTDFVITSPATGQLLAYDGAHWVNVAPVALLGGTLYVSTSAVGNVGGGEDTLATYTVPAGQLASNGDSLWFEASGSQAANTNAKTLRVRFGTSGTNLVFSSALDAAGSAHQWSLHGRIIRTGAATQKASTTAAAFGVTEPASLATGLDQTLAGALALKVTGEGVSNDDVVIESFVVGWDKGA